MKMSNISGNGSFFRSMTQAFFYPTIYDECFIFNEYKKNIEQMKTLDNYLMDGTTHLE